MNSILADSSLSPTEKEDNKVENLIDKETPHSRKYVEKRGPKNDNRKRRITEDDKDLKSGVEADKDMSLNYKYSAQDLLSFIALRVADEAKTGVKQLKAIIQAFENELREASSIVADQFAAYAKFLYIDDLQMLLNEGYTDNADEYIETIKLDRQDYKVRRRNLYSTIRSADASAIADIVASSWPDGSSKFGERAAVIWAIKKAIKNSPLPDSLKIPFMRKNVKGTINDKKFIKHIIENSQKGPRDLDESAIPKFVQLVAALQMVSDVPDSVDARQLQEGIDDLTEEIKSQFRELADLNLIMKDWHSAVSQFQHKSPEKLEIGKSSSDYDKVIKSVDDFMNKPSKVIDLDSYKKEMEQYAEDHYGIVPDEMKSILRAATSNKTNSNRNMTTRTAEYHGIVKQRANPVQTTNTGYKSYDKRYFGKDHYDSILKCAQDILKEDGWFKSGWDGGFEDATFRAALDIAIHTADDSLYQSKIDVEQYNVLLNKLAKWGYKTFSDTVLPFKNGSKREASMNQAQRTLIQIANDIRNSNPKSSLALLKIIRAAEIDLDNIEFSAPAAEELKEAIDAKLDWDNMDLEGFINGMNEAFDMIHEKVASSLHPMIRRIWASRARISAEDIPAYNPEKINQLIEDAKKEYLALDSSDIDKFIEGFDALFENVRGELKQAATATVPIGALVQLAGENPAVRSVLIPFIVSHKEAHIAKVKKSKKKKSPPPFAKQKKDEEDIKKAKAKKGKKSSKKRTRKASYASEDLNW